MTTKIGLLAISAMYDGDNDGEPLFRDPINNQRVPFADALNRSAVLKKHRAQPLQLYEAITLVFPENYLLSGILFQRMIELPTGM